MLISRNCLCEKLFEQRIGEGKPEFVVNFKKPVSMHSLLTSTSLALGEAYMNGDLEIEGDLYYTCICLILAVGGNYFYVPVQQRL